jgi:hypothetical protein
MKHEATHSNLNTLFVKLMFVMFAAGLAWSQVPTAVPSPAPPRLSYFIPAGANAWQYPLWIDTAVLAVVPIGTTGQWMLTLKPAGKPCVSTDGQPTLMVKLGDGTCLPVIVVTSTAAAANTPVGEYHVVYVSERRAPWKLVGITIP